VQLQQKASASFYKVIILYVEINVWLHFCSDGRKVFLIHRQHIRRALQCREREKMQSALTIFFNGEELLLPRLKK